MAQQVAEALGDRAQHDVLIQMTGFAPPMLLALSLRLAVHSQQHLVQTVTTNVPGPQFPLYAVGRKMLYAYPYVPIAGSVRIGVAVFSYLGGINFGVTGDYDSVPDIEMLTRGIESGIAELLTVGRRHHRTTRVAPERSFSGNGASKLSDRGQRVKRDLHIAQRVQ